MSGPRRMGIRLPESESEQDAVDAIYGCLTSGSQDVGRGFTKADDDWHPLWLVTTAAGQGTIISPVEMIDQADKIAITEYVARFARKVGAVAVGHLNSSWLVAAEDVGDERMKEINALMKAQYGSTEGIPERREILMLIIYTATSWRQYYADIKRHDGRPPTLKPWVLMGSSEQSWNLTGTMSDPIRESLRRIG